MKVQVTYNIEPFEVPVTVKTTKGLNILTTEIDSLALEALCRELTNSVFKAANKSRPAREAR